MSMVITMSMSVSVRLLVGLVVRSRVVAPFERSETFQRGEDGVVRGLVEDGPGEE
jgi:hypothetical protein